MLFSFVQAVEANVNDVEKLLLNSSATVDDGKNLANRRLLSVCENVSYEAVVTDTDILAAIDYVLRLRHDRSRMERLLKFGKQLLEEKV